VTGDEDDLSVSYARQAYDLRAAGTAQVSQTKTIWDLVRIADPRRYIGQARSQRDATLDGEPVTRYGGVLDLATLFRQFDVLGRGGHVSASTTPSPPDQRMRYEADVARSDGGLRRIFGAFLAADDANNVRFELRLKNVRKPVTIAAPQRGASLDVLLGVLVKDLGL
jgi:hypothetical protein